MPSDQELEKLAHREFWDDRYAAESQPPAREGDEPGDLPTYEWAKGFADLAPFFTANLPKPESGCHVLHLGCGNSSLTADLHAQGYTRQTSVDFSPVVIAAMASKYAALGLSWRVMDIRQLDLPSASIDVAIDKLTLDAMVHGSCWDPPADVRENVGRYVDEVARVLKPGGTWVYITYRQPHFMRGFLEREAWADMKMEVLLQPGGCFEYFGWVMTKKEAAVGEGLVVASQL